MGIGDKSMIEYDKKTQDTILEASKVAIDMFMNLPHTKKMMNSLTLLNAEEQELCIKGFLIGYFLKKEEEIAEVQRIFKEIIGSENNHMKETVH
jgi:hypothetical protein